MPEEVIAYAAVPSDTASARDKRTMTRSGWFARTMPTSSRRLPRSVAPTKAIVPSSPAGPGPGGD